MALGGSLIKSLGGKPYIVERVLDGSYNDETGQWEPGNTVTVPVIASVQPLSGKEIIRLPDLERTRTRLKVYSDTELRPHDEDTGAAADTFIYQGKPFQVESAEHWGGYWKAIIIKIERATLPVGA